MNQILTKDNQEVSEVKKGFIKTEVNFLQYPVGTLDKHYKGNEIIYKEITKDGSLREWAITANSKAGLPGPTAVELDNVISKLIQDKRRWIGGEIPRWIRASYYEIAKELNKNYDRKLRKKIGSDLYKLFGLSITSKKTFKRKGLKKDHPDFGFHKYDSVALRGEAIPDQIPREILTESERKTETAEVAYIVLGEVYWQSLKANYTKPINHKFMMSLKSAVLQRMYQLLSLGFQTRMSKDKNGLDCLNYNYTEFCGRLPLKVWMIKSQAKQKLEPYLKELVNHNYIKKYEFEFERSQERWFIRFYPSSIALEELEVIQGQRLLFDQVMPQVEERRRLKRIKGWEIKRKEMEKKGAEQKKQEEEQREKEEQILWRNFESLPQEEQEAIRTQAEQQANGTRFFRRLGEESKREWVEGAISLILKERFRKV